MEVSLHSNALMPSCERPANACKPPLRSTQIRVQSVGHEVDSHFGWVSFSWSGAIGQQEDVAAIDGADPAPETSGKPLSTSQQHSVHLANPGHE